MVSPCWRRWGEGSSAAQGPAARSLPSAEVSVNEKEIALLAQRNIDFLKTLYPSTAPFPALVTAGPRRELWGSGNGGRIEWVEGAGLLQWAPHGCTAGSRPRSFLFPFEIDVGEKKWVQRHLEPYKTASIMTKRERKSDNTILSTVGKNHGYYTVFHFTRGKRCINTCACLLNTWLCDAHVVAESATMTIWVTRCLRPDDRYLVDRHSVQTSHGTS